MSTTTSAFSQSDSYAIRNVRAPTLKDTLGGALAFAFLRDDGTSSAFYSDAFKCWIKAGIDTAGVFAVGDNDQWSTLIAPGAASPPKVGFGAEGGGRAVLVNSDALAPSASPKYVQSPASASDFSGTWTTRTLDASPGGYDSVVQAWDACATAAGTLIVVGGGDRGGANLGFCWRSTDGGNSFTRINAATLSVTGQCLTRVAVGGGQLVAVCKAASGLSGSKVFYSNDDGLTWRVRSSIGFGDITNVAYTSRGTWAFSTGSTIYTTPDVETGAFTGHAQNGTVTAMAGSGDALVYATNPSVARQEIYVTRGAFAEPATCVWRNMTLAADICTNIVASPSGQLLLQGVSWLALTDRP